MKIKNLQYRSLWYKKNYYYLKSGQSLSNSTRIASDCQETLEIHQEIKNGLRLSDILSDDDFIHIFQKTEISFIRVAEQTGNIDNIFLSLSNLLKDQYIQKQKLINAFIYPAIVLFMTFSLLFLILFIIIPKISPLFKDLENLPIITKIIMSLSDHLIKYWYIDFFILILIAFIFIYLKNNNLIINIKDKIKSFILNKIIYIKDIYFYWYIEKWLKVIHMSISSGISISESLIFAYESINDKDLKTQFKDLQNSIEKGNNFSTSLKLLKPKLYRKIKDWESVIDSGEKTGKYKEVFEICHLSIKENLYDAFDKFQRMIEPALIVFVGLMVLTICISIILPMYQLTQSLQ